MGTAIVLLILSSLVFRRKLLTSRKQNLRRKLVADELDRIGYTVLKEGLVSYGEGLVHIHTPLAVMYHENRRVRLIIGFDVLNETLRISQVSCRDKEDVKRWIQFAEDMGRALGLHHCYVLSAEHNYYYDIGHDISSAERHEWIESLKLVFVETPKSRKYLRKGKWWVRQIPQLKLVS